MHIRQMQHIRFNRMIDTWESGICPNYALLILHVQNKRSAYVHT